MKRSIEQIIASAFLFLVVSTLYAQQVKVLKIKDLKAAVFKQNDTTYIVNFWATWCGPCVKELPEFDKVTENAKSNKSKVKVLLVSMDFKEDLKTKLLPFLKTKPQKSQVCLLDESNADYFIPQLDDRWSGALPATMMIKNKKVIRFFERKITEKDLIIE